MLLTLYPYKLSSYMHMIYVDVPTTFHYTAWLDALDGLVPVYAPFRAQSHFLRGSSCRLLEVRQAFVRDARPAKLVAYILSSLALVALGSIEIRQPVGEWCSAANIPTAVNMSQPDLGNTS